MAMARMLIVTAISGSLMGISLSHVLYWGRGGLSLLFAVESKGWKSFYYREKLIDDFRRPSSRVGLHALPTSCNLAIPDGLI
jgi:hypothetical protein